MKKQSAVRSPLVPSPLPTRIRACLRRRRVRDLLSRMTLEEKAAQMMCVWQEKAQKLVDEKGDFDEDEAKKAFRDRRGVGQVGRPSDAGGRQNGARHGGADQRHPEIFSSRTAASAFPSCFMRSASTATLLPKAPASRSPSRLGATFNPELVESLFTMTALEARLRGAHHALTPVVDVAREPRWGRVEEPTAKTPTWSRASALPLSVDFRETAISAIKRHILATLKHFVGHGQPESGMNCAPANVSERVLRETFFYTFNRNSAGKPAQSPSWLLTTKSTEFRRTRTSGCSATSSARKMGFKGFVVSDYYAVWELGYRPDTHGHFVAKDKKESCALAVNAGVNIELPDPDCYLHLVELVKKGVLKESQLDELVAPMLFWKFEMGLFDDPYVDPKQAERVVGSKPHRELALKAAQEAITLLKK